MKAQNYATACLRGAYTMRRKTRLTKAQVESLRADGKETSAWEMSLPGFGVRKTRGGATSFIVQYRDFERRSRRMTLGRYPLLSVGAARRKALEVLAAVQPRENPAQERLQKAQAATMAELLDRCLAEYATRLRDGELKPRTLTPCKERGRKRALGAGEARLASKR